jgi:hypothetical protein
MAHSLRRAGQEPEGAVDVDDAKITMASSQIALRGAAAIVQITSRVEKGTASQGENASESKLSVRIRTRKLL